MPSRTKRKAAELGLEKKRRLRKKAEGEQAAKNTANTTSCTGSGYKIASGAETTGRALLSCWNSMQLPLWSLESGYFNCHHNVSEDL